MKAEMRRPTSSRLRGPFKYANNNIPIQNFYLQDVVKDADASSRSDVSDHRQGRPNRFHDKCPMK